MATGRLPDPNTAPVTAKGDLYTYSTVPAKLAVGNNGETLVADSSASTGLRYNPTMAAGKNYCINGAFDIWQRGTTFTNPSSAGIYTADRWTVYFNGNGTVTQETSVKPDTSTYALKVTATASSADNSVYQLIEQLNMEQFRGKTITLSVKVAGTATLAPAIALAYSTTADNSLTATNTAITASSETKPAINASTFVTYISQFAVPTTAKTLRIQLGSGTMANTNVLYWAEAQIEIGSTATAFSRAGGTLAGELGACQRYYYRIAGNSAYSYTGYGSGYSSTVAFYVVPMKQTMRVEPTAIDYANIGTSDLINATIAFTALTIDSAGSGPDFLLLQGTVASGITQYRPYYINNNNNAAGYIGFSSEL